ncbi:MAG: SDR family NAD(P)-dependent oxidoreductase, partial [Promethearchaeota archaeon]
EEIYKNIQGSSNVDVMKIDTSSIKSIREFSQQYHKKYSKLDVLINNAGVYKPVRSTTEEGFETTFAVNYIAPFLLTNLLIELLKKSTSSRIVNVASRVHSNQFDFKNLQFERGYTGVKAYAQSKTALILFTYLLADKLKNTNVVANCLHPGVINTKLLRAAYGSYGVPVLEGAKTLIFAATSQELETVTGKYLVSNHPELSKDITYNKTIQKMLWNRTEELIGSKFDL